MSLIEKKFLKLGAEYAPGQEVRNNTGEVELHGEKISGTAVDFSHGDVDAFEPIPGTLDDFIEGEFILAVSRPIRSIVGVKIFGRM